MSKWGCKCENYVNGRCIGEGQCELKSKIEELENKQCKEISVIVNESLEQNTKRYRTALEEIISSCATIGEAVVKAKDALNPSEKED